jgi:hypothetical protein
MPEMFDQAPMRDAIQQRHIEWRKHALQRMFERSIDRHTVLDTIMSGEVIEIYEQDKPFPSALFFKMINRRPIHTVASYDLEKKIVYIITAYEPNQQEFEQDFKTRRKK